MRVAIVALLAACGSSQSPRADPSPGISPEPAPTEKPVDKPVDKWGAKHVDRGAAPAADRASATDRSAMNDRPSPAKGDAPAAKGSKLDATAQAFVDAHNRARAKHCAPPLTWSPKLAQVAQSWANELQKKGCTFGHSPGRKYGENLAGGTVGALDPESTTAMWYDEIKLYKFASGGFSMETGHFTQLVWTTTTQVGCGHVQCKGNDIYVCNYDPPGNWEGQYRQHVLPTSCKK